MAICEMQNPYSPPSETGTEISSQRAADEVPREATAETGIIEWAGRILVLATLFIFLVLSIFGETLDSLVFGQFTQRL